MENVFDFGQIDCERPEWVGQGNYDTYSYKLWIFTEKAGQSDTTTMLTPSPTAPSPILIYSMSGVVVILLIILVVFVVLFCIKRKHIPTSNIDNDSNYESAFYSSPGNLHIGSTDTGKIIYKNKLK